MKKQKLLIDDKERQKRYERMRTTPGDNLELTFQVTNECNLRCTYCYETKFHSSMTFETAKKAIDTLFVTEKI